MNISISIYIYKGQGKAARDYSVVSLPMSRGGLSVSVSS